MHTPNIQKQDKTQLTEQNGTSLSFQHRCFSIGGANVAMSS